MRRMWINGILFVSCTSSGLWFKSHILSSRVFFSFFLLVFFRRRRRKQNQSRHQQSAHNTHICNRVLYLRIYHAIEIAVCTVSLALVCAPCLLCMMVPIYISLVPLVASVPCSLRAQLLSIHTYSQRWFSHTHCVAVHTTSWPMFGCVRACESVCVVSVCCVWQCVGLIHVYLRLLHYMICSALMYIFFLLWWNEKVHKTSIYFYAFIYLFRPFVAERIHGEDTLEIFKCGVDDDDDPMIFNDDVDDSEWCIVAMSHILVGPSVRWMVRLFSSCLPFARPNIGFAPIEIEYENRSNAGQAKWMWIFSKRKKTIHSCMARVSPKPTIFIFVKLAPL